MTRGRSKLSPRKLLVASAGVATLAYLGACDDEGTVTGNLVAPDPSHRPTVPAEPSGQPVAPVVATVTATPNAEKPEESPPTKQE